MKAVYLISLLLPLCAASTGQARTWRVNTAGTGDAPNLYAAMDSAAARDTVLVAPGQYELHAELLVPEGVWLVGESGPMKTLLSNNDIFATTSAVSLRGAMAGIHVRAVSEDVVFAYGNNEVGYCILEATYGTALNGWPNVQTFVHNCLFIDGPVRLAAGYYFNIFLSALTSDASGALFYENDVLGPVDPALDVSAGNLNFSLDPLFCGIPGSGNYYLQSTSPCLPANSPMGIPDVVGPLGVGCGAVRVETRTWGGVKALYRKP